MKIQLDRLMVVVLLLTCIAASCPAGMAEIQVPDQTMRVQKTIRGELGESIEVSAEISAMPSELYSFTLRPVALDRLSEIIETFYGAEAAMVQESKDEHQLSYRLINPKASPGTSNAHASLDIWFRDQSLAFIDYRRNLNGEIVPQRDAPNCALTRDEAIEEAKAFLESLGVNEPIYLRGDAVRSNTPNGKGYYHFIFSPTYYGISFAQNVTGGSSMVLPSYPMVSIAISDEGVFSVNGRFLYTMQDAKRVETALNIEGVFDMLAFYINTGLLSNIAPLPVEISLEYISAMTVDGGYSVRPVWVLRSDPDKMRQEWAQDDMYLMNLVIYADDGTIAAM